jgi:uncharacterized protein YcbK (DUF882 family)
MSINFRPEELSCPCCKKYIINKHLMSVLELVRCNFNAPVTITSGLRCEEHNAKVGGAENSEHLLGTAADIVVKDIDPVEVYDYLDELFPSWYGLGKYDTFTHIDVRKSKARW